MPDVFETIDQFKTGFEAGRKSVIETTVTELKVDNQRLLDENECVKNNFEGNAAALGILQNYSFCLEKENAALRAQLSAYKSSMSAIYQVYTNEVVLLANKNPPVPVTSCIRPAKRHRASSASAITTNPNPQQATITALLEQPRVTIAAAASTAPDASTMFEPAAAATTNQALTSDIN